MVEYKTAFKCIAERSFSPRVFCSYRILHLIAICVFLFCHCNKIPFQDRIVSMTLDKEYDVAVEAIRLVTLILQ